LPYSGSRASALGSQNSASGLSGQIRPAPVRYAASGKMPDQSNTPLPGHFPMKYPSSHDLLAHVERHNPGQPEFLQAVTEVMEVSGRTSASIPSTPSTACSIAWSSRSG